MHRFFVDPSSITRRAVRFDDDQAHQIRRVLRLRPGDRVLALDGRGYQYEVTLEEVSNARVAGSVADRATSTGEPQAQLILYQSLLRREKFEWVLQKGTELGIVRFVPVITRRSLLRDAEDVTPEKLIRWRRIIKEAAEQSGRGLLPELAPTITFAAALETLAVERALIAWEGATTGTVRDALRPIPRFVALFVGPEGGFDADEIEQAAGRGAIPITLGRRILRTETAAITGAAIILHELGELGQEWTNK